MITKVVRTLWRKVVVAAGNQPHFVVDGKRVYRTVGWLVAALGLSLILMGTMSAGVGSQARSRYEQTSGRLARIFSERDQEYFNRLGGLIAFGHSLQIAGGLLIMSGAAVILFPFGAWRAVTVVDRKIRPARSIQGDHEIPAAEPG